MAAHSSLSLSAAQHHATRGGLGGATSRTGRGLLPVLPSRRRRGAAAATSLLATTAPPAAARTASEEAVYEVVLRQAALVEGAGAAGRTRKGRWSEAAVGGGLLGWGLLSDAYDRCGEVCAEYAKTFYLGEPHLSIAIVFFTTTGTSFLYTDRLMEQNSQTRLQPSDAVIFVLVERVVHAVICLDMELWWQATASAHLYICWISL
jgi:hypothetical protein